MIRLLLFIILLLRSTLSESQGNPFLHQEKGGIPNNAIRVVFYNVENLFDTIDDPSTRDEDFLPGSKRNWNTPKYFSKLNHLSKVLRLCGGMKPPDIIGLAEIENRSVLEDLIRRPSLEKHDYGILHFESPDHRGIDVALLFRKSRFFPLYSVAIHVRDTLDADFTTRDILYAKGIVNGGDTIHLFVNHWPSRRGGRLYSEPKRLLAASVLDGFLDSLERRSSPGSFIVMGDFNDEFHDRSIRTILGARFEKDSADRIDLMADLNPNMGTHYYRGVWAYLDQFIVSKDLRDGKNRDVSIPKVFQPDYVLEGGQTGKKFPKRTWKGAFFANGFSDHLPIIVDLFIHIQR